MDTIEAYPSPAIKPEPRWAAREDMIDRVPSNDGYRNRRSPGKAIRDRGHPLSIPVFPIFGFFILFCLHSKILYPIPVLCRSQTLFNQSPLS